MSPRSWLIYFRTLLCRSNGSINYTARTIVRLYVSLENRAEWRATNLFWVPIKSRTTTCLLWIDKGLKICKVETIGTKACYGSNRVHTWQVRDLKKSDLLAFAESRLKDFSSKHDKTWQAFRRERTCSKNNIFDKDKSQITCICVRQKQKDFSPKHDKTWAYRMHERATSCIEKKGFTRFFFKSEFLEGPGFSRFITSWQTTSALDRYPFYESILVAFVLTFGGTSSIPGSSLSTVVSGVSGWIWTEDGDAKWSGITTSSMWAHGVLSGLRWEGLFILLTFILLV
jgi:hypothetical protein